MIKISTTLYKKLIIQAQEAKIQGLHKLADNIHSSIAPDDEVIEYPHAKLEEDIQKELWKLSLLVMKYYDLTNIDALKMDDLIHQMSEEFLEKLEGDLKVNKKHSLEPKTIGEE